MSGLTKAQRERLIEMADGTVWVASKFLRPAKWLSQNGLAERVSFNRFCITDLGRATLKAMSGERRMGLPSNCAEAYAAGYRAALKDAAGHTRTRAELARRAGHWGDFKRPLLEAAAAIEALPVREG